MLLVVFGGCAKSTLPDHPHAAGSFIKLGNRLIVVEDVWSGKISLPGGGQKANESLEETARRETFEETGILVTVGKELHRTNDFVLFQCKPVKVVCAIKLQSKGKPLYYWIPHLNVPRNEIEKVLLIDPMLYKAKEFRFPSQLEITQKLFVEEKGSGALEIIEKPLRRVHKLEYSGIRFIKGIQKFDGKIIKGVFHVFSFLGNGGVIFLTVPYFLLCLPRNQGQGFLFLLVISSLINGILKDLFGLARPFEADPSVQWMKTSGFGFPSGHTQLATVFFGYFFWRVRSCKIKLCLIVTVLFIGFSRIYFGVHYPHDVVGGWFLGAMIVSIYYVLASRELIPIFYNEQNFCWVFFVSVALLSMLLRFHPDTVAMLSLWCGLLCGNILSGKITASLPPSFGFWQKTVRTLIGILGMGFIVFIFHLITPEDKTFFTMFTIQVLEYLCLGVWLSWGSFTIVDALKYI